YPTLAKDKDELLHTADGALYWGKLQGKNNVLTYDPQVVEALSAEERTKRVEEAALLDLVKTLVTAVDAKDEYTGLHSNGVSDMAGKLARQIGLDEEAINRVEVAGMLHDVGKIGMPDSILNKPSRLTDDEMAIIKTHPELSAQIINSTSLKDVVPAVRSHHERWDGNGYPNGLKGKQIPLEARILAIADTYDAMITDRPYRKGLPVDDAITEIKRSAGTQLDPELVGHFLALFSYRNTKKRSAAAREKRPEANCKVVANS
ncbi:HD-GYP domain-containing protein, partial [Candidatus Aquicultor secundus]|uniref:HD-GYP domain-containing protein n=3 Tax=Candidatus Aquicultor secundus TaxID=1973895 RepID=UPI000B30A9B0